ncbi:hypothetical protein Tco_0441388 [Tanacetum coccineum]
MSSDPMRRLRFVRDVSYYLLVLRYKVGESSAAGAARQLDLTARADLYGFVICSCRSRTANGIEELGLSDEIIYSQLDDARYDRALLRARVNMLYRDRPFHRRTALLMDEEARLSRAAWARSMDACDQVHSEGISLRTTVMAQQSEITELQAADRRRQTVITDLLKADYRRQRQLVEALKIVKSLKTQMIELQRQQGPAKDLQSQSYQRRPVAVLRLGYDCSYCTPTKYYEYISASMALGAMIDEGVTAVLAARATTRNGDDSHTSGTGVRRNERTVRECTYQDFMKCQPLFFRGTEGVVDLTQWFERMETVFRISNCTVENQVKFALHSYRKLLYLVELTC